MIITGVIVIVINCLKTGIGEEFTAINTVLIMPSDTLLGRVHREFERDTMSILRVKKAMQRIGHRDKYFPPGTAPM